MIKPDCARCGGSGWVCEDHPERAWEDGDGCCGAAGMPCACNRDPIEFPPDSIDVLVLVPPN